MHMLRRLWPLRWWIACKEEKKHRPCAVPLSGGALPMTQQVRECQRPLGHPCGGLPVRRNGQGAAADMLPLRPVKEQGDCR
eukprot:scaffold190762_cov21-Tisochrysis_lutea.AAC.2